MSELIASVEQELDTDFALLNALQQGVIDVGSSMTYASSGPGGVHMVCGTKYASAHVRLERWDGRPEPAGDEWEDCDELPWDTLADAGPVLMSGFDPPDPTEGLPVGGLGRARVQVLATGRHRYEYGGTLEDLPPERWLLRFWPDHHARDAMAGRPRRLAGTRPFSVQLGGWQAALHAWRQTGWHSYLSSLEAFGEIQLALSRIRRPFLPDELPPLFGPWGMQRERGGPYAWDSPVLGHGWAIQIDEESNARRLRVLAAAAGLTSIETFGDALTCLQQIGLLTRCEGPSHAMLTPNPAPRPVWETLDLLPAAAHGLQTQALYADYQDLEGDLQHLLRWAPDQRLVTTALRIAIRLSLSATDVLGTLRLLAHRDFLRLSPPADVITADTLVTITPTPRPPT